MDVQMKKGLLEICVLKALSDGESYGYKIIKDVSAYIDISESTLVSDFETAGIGRHLVCTTAAHNGRLRKYYGITASGRNRIQAFLEEWKEVMAVYRYISEDTEGENDAKD